MKMECGEMRPYHCLSLDENLMDPVSISKIDLEARSFFYFFLQNVSYTRLDVINT